MTAPLNKPRTPPYKLAGIVLALIAVVVLVLVFLQFRGDLLPRTQLTMLASRSGLSLNEGSKVTLNGVQIGRVTGTEVVSVGGEPQAKILLEVNPKYLELIPKNVDASIDATTVFGNKYVNFNSPENPSPEHLTKNDVIDATSVTTEFNTLFETIVDVAEQVDPIKLNQTLTATAEALDGLGDRFGESIIDGNEILTDVNARMPELRRDNRLLADLTEVYANAAPDLFDALGYAVTTAQTLNEQRGNLDQALVASVGFGNTGADVFERSGPYLVRALEDLIPTSETLDEYSPALFCTIRNFHDLEPKVAASLGGDGYSLQTLSTIEGAGNPYVYPDNLPRVNARGGPEGRPGCWQPITRDLYPAPYLVADTGASIAPYNHFELGQPLLIEYVWGRQVGENTINP
ncbi:MCE family protein [Mycobacterium sp. IDR2000157661]|uniref:MCE family protein n=1 Tax=Mycobacterium sp. IDR2000157661 TaxID=2867005 RepID=UPI001EECF5D8|nr:MCE family protein [Mycobacterium sp. IDR2000157661]ULE34818.1 MCE family protein [Mycobacterium sp. IDR2000157661]